MMEAILALLFGLIIGSFLNVCIYRWPRDLSVVRPRSHCTSCEKTIAWYDNVPLVSYFALGGRCRHCGARISWRYPVVELATGLLFFYFVSSDGVTVLALKMCVFSALLVGLIFADLEERILPDEMTKGGIVLGLIFAWFVPLQDIGSQAILGIMQWWFGLHVPAKFESPVQAAIGAGVPAFFLWLGGFLYEKVRHREGLGFGDVKLIAMVGAFLGLQASLTTLLFGSLAGAVIGFSYIKLTHKDASSYELPFGTFLGIAGLFAGIMAKGM
ncbi:MAG TPA: prepilin peptidase [Bryobacteraceae bacterium]|nr:prepilin peptidase [Bryobacteraceae bacterium]